MSADQRWTIVGIETIKPGSVILGYRILVRK